MKRKSVRNTAITLGFLVVAGASLFLVGCMRESNGVFIVNEAPLPEGWPKLTRVGEVEVKTYPVYRAAVVEDEPTDAAVSPMFNQLFDHIKSNDIPMTAPVEMGYQDASADKDDLSPPMTSMAFLYRDPGVGRLDEGSNVAVRDVSEQTFASIGVRGDYNDEQFAEALSRLRTWLDEHPQYTVTGPPRTLGYNSPFVPAAFRYGEVQLPVAATE